MGRGRVVELHYLTYWEGCGVRCWKIPASVTTASLKIPAVLPKKPTPSSIYRVFFIDLSLKKLFLTMSMICTYISSHTHDRRFKNKRDTNRPTTKFGIPIMWSFDCRANISFRSIFSFIEYSLCHSQCLAWLDWPSHSVPRGGKKYFGICLEESNGYYFLKLWLISDLLQKKSAQKLHPKENNGLSKSATSLRLYCNLQLLVIFYWFSPKTAKKWSRLS